MRNLNDKIQPRVVKIKSEKIAVETDFITVESC